MAISIVSTSSAVVAVAATSVSLPLPTGAQDGDVLVVGITNSENTAAQDVTAPAGWTQVDDVQEASTTAQRMSTWYKVADDEAGPYVFTTPAVDNFAAGMICFRGVDVFTPIDVHAMASSAGMANVPTPSITTTVDGCMIVGFWGSDDTNANALATWTMVDNPPLATKDIDVQDGTQHTTQLIAHYQQRIASALQLKATWPVSTTSCIVGVLALVPASEKVDQGNYCAFPKPKLART